MTTKNDITGDSIKSKPTSRQFRDNFDRIFNKEPKEKEIIVDTQWKVEYDENGWGISYSDKPE